MIQENITQSPLPKGWARTRLGDLVDFQYGKGLVEVKRDKSGTVPVYGSNGMVGYHSSALTNKPSLIVGRKGAVGEVHLAKVPCWPIDTTYYVYPPQGVDLIFMYYLMSSLNMNLLDKSTAIPGLNRNDAYVIVVALPPSPEQHRIVAKIEKLFTRLDAGVEVLGKIKLQLKRYRQAVLKAAFEGKLTADWREAHKGELEPASVLLEKIKADRMRNGKYKKPLLLDRTELHTIPESWAWASVGDLYDIVGGGTPSTSIAEYWDGDIPWITSADIHGLKDIRPRKSITELGIENSATNLVPAGSLIVVTRVGLGKIALANTSLCFSQDSQALTGNNSLVFPYYSLYYLSDAVQRFKYEHRGTTIAGVTKKQLSEVPFALPSFSEQERIAGDIERYLSIADAIEKTVEHSLIQGRRLRQSILKKAFEGKLVPQDPNNEPAERLLERMKAEKVRQQASVMTSRVRNRRSLSQGRLM